MSSSSSASASAGAPSAAAAEGKIEGAHRMYREGRHEAALEIYTEALATAKTRPHRIALHSNRAACYLKLHRFHKAADECTSVLELDHEHTGALMLRAQTLVTLKEYQSALFDVNRLMELNPSSEVYKSLQARLRTQLSLAPIPESEEEALCLEEDEEETLGKGTMKKSEAASTTFVNRPSKTTNNEIQHEVHSKPHGWEAIPKPKGHSGLDYSRWDKIEGDSSDDDEDEEEDQQPQYRFRVRKVGVRPVE